MSLVTGQQLADFLHRTYDGDDDPLHQAVDLAEGVVKGYTGQDLEESTRTHKLPLRGYWVDLPQRPVAAVNSITLPVSGALENSQWRWDGVSPWVQLTDVDRDDQYASVTYTAGYSQIPSDVQAVTLSVAARVYTNPDTKRSEQIDDYSVTYAGGDSFSGMALTPAEKTILRRYRSSLGTIRPAYPKQMNRAPSFEVSW